MDTAATTPAITANGGPARRAAILYANRIASSPPARARTSHSSGAMSPNSENGVVNSTGSGFHDEPAVVSRLRCATSRPHTIHDHESCVGTDGPASDSAAMAKQPSTSSGSVGTARLRRSVAAGTAACRSAISVKVGRRPRGAGQDSALLLDPERPSRAGRVVDLLLAGVVGRARVQHVVTGRQSLAQPPRPVRRAGGLEEDARLAAVDRK